MKNIANAHVQVAKAFLSNNQKVPGSTYFITDGQGENFFKFYEQVVEGAGYRIWPKDLWLPYWLAYSIAGMVEFIAWLIRPVKKVNPKFSRFAVIYTCSNFTFSSVKAKRDFGFELKYSVDEALNRTIEFYRKFNQIESNK